MNEQNFETMMNVLQELLKWSKFQGWQKAKNVLLDTLENDLLKLLYQLSDGKSSTAIADKLPISHVTVTKYWNKWAKIGIVKPMQVKGGTRYKRVFSLDEFGIEIPTIKSVNGE